MTAARKGLIVGLVQCALVLSLTGKLLYDRATRPRVWVKAAPWDPNLPIRGRYLSLQLIPETGAMYFQETDHQRVVFFVPERRTAIENARAGGKGPDIWAEVTIPRKGPPRPIRLGTKTNGRIVPFEIN
jgi:hypothetical protein